MTQQLARNDQSVWSIDSVARRIKLYQQPGWGLERASGPQLNLLALYCQKMQLLPGEEVTLYDGKPWITVDGRVTLMRRHKDEYRGHELRPLTKDEKILWGYDDGDIVVECSVRTRTTGVIKAYGRVSINELDGTPEMNPDTGRPAERLNPLARRGRKPVEMAMKRALARGERFAFGTAHDDEDPQEVARIFVEERNDPQRIASNAAAYDRMIGANYDDAERAIEDSPPSDRAPSTERQVTAKTDPLWREWLVVEREARQAGIEQNTAAVTLPISEESLRASIADLKSMVAEQEQLPA